MNRGGSQRNNRRSQASASASNESSPPARAPASSTPTGQPAAATVSDDEDDRMSNASFPSTGANSRTPVPDPEMEQFVEAERQALDTALAPATEQMERRTVTSAETAQRAIIKMNEDGERRKSQKRFRERRRKIAGRESATGSPRSTDETSSPLPTEEVRSPPGADAVGSLTSPEVTGSPAAISPSVRPQSTMVFSDQAGQEADPSRAAADGDKAEASGGAALPPRGKPLFYGAAALPVKSTSMPRPGADGASASGAAAADDAQSSRTSAAAPTPTVESSATRETRYASPTQEADLNGTFVYKDGGARAEAGRTDSGLGTPTGAGNVASRPVSSSPPPPVSPTIAAICRAGEQDERRSKAFFWPLSVAPPLSYDEQQEEAFYLPFRDTHYYCYSLEEELPALRTITVEQAQEAAAEGTLCTPTTQNLEPMGHYGYGAADEFNARARFSRGAARTGSEESLTSLEAVQMNVNGALAVADFPRTMPSQVPGDQRSTSSRSSSRGRADVGKFSPVPEFVPHVHRYHVPQLQRIWVTSVLRQNLFFTLFSAFMAVLVAPTVICGSLLDIYAATAQDGFYASQNRFGAALALSSVEILSSGVAVGLVAFVVVATATHRARAADRTASSVAAALLSPRVMLVSGAAVAAAGVNLLYYAGIESRARVATIAKLCSGAGAGLSFCALMLMAFAEVGIAAGVVVVVQTFFLLWLIVCAALYYIVPFLLDSWVTTADVLHSIATMETTLLVFAAALAMLFPRDMLRRSTTANYGYLAASALRKASREVTTQFVLRVLSSAVLFATMLLLGMCSTPILTRRPAGNGRGGRAGESELVPADPRQQVSAMFIVAAVMWPFCLVPVSAAWINRSLSTTVLTVILALLWTLYAMFDPPVNLGSGGRDGDADYAGGAAGGGGGDDDGAGNGRGAAGQPSALAVLVSRFLRPKLCVMVTGFVYAIVMTSVTRAIANSGATLPIHPAHNRHRATAKKAWPWPRRSPTARSETASSQQQVAGSEAVPLLPGGTRSQPRTPTSASATPIPEGDDRALSASTESLEDCTAIRARFIFQRRGGPSAVVMLSFTLVGVCSVVCTLSQAVASALLSDLYQEHGSVSIAKGVPLNMHQSLLWMVAGLCGLAAVFELLEQAVVMHVNAQRKRLEI